MIVNIPLLLCFIIIALPSKEISQFGLPHKEWLQFVTEIWLFTFDIERTVDFAGSSCTHWVE